jgi:hypothetical protein
MKKSIRWHVAGMGILLLAVTTARAEEEEEKVPLDKIPKPLMEAVNARFKDAAVTAAVKEKEDGELVYELSLKVKGQTVDVILTSEGTIRLIEKTIAAKDLPSAVVKSLEDNYPKATYKKFEEVILVDENKEYPPYYEGILVTARKRNIEVEMAPDGTIVNEGKLSDLEVQLTMALH